MILKEYVTGPIEVNTYALFDEDSKEAVLIDVGGSFEEIKEEISQLGYSIKFILNTHGHFDHVLGEVEVQQNYPEIPIYIHKDDTPHFSRLKEEMSFFGIPSNVESLKIDTFIDETTSLFIGKHKIQIFHTPGHSKGSLCYYIDDMLFSGDALFFRSIGRTDFYDGDYDELITSIKSKLMKLPENTKVYPGHGPSTTIAEEKKHNQYLI
ncbi:MAG: MBL fold metallo-hydrolase [Cyanobacteria bacterium SIG29]|nr:MBL fold metallo-hydrolase [Cyanobacteria bacterium SIG29]